MGGEEGRCDRRLRKMQPLDRATEMQLPRDSDEVPAVAELYR